MNHHQEPNLEKISRGFQESIQTVVWPELTILIIHDHLQFLLDHFHRPNYLPYYLETFEYLHEALTGFDKINHHGAGVPPEVFTNLFSGIEKSKPIGLENHVPALMTEIRGRLYERIVRSYFRLLAWRKLNTFLGIDENPAIQLFSSANDADEIPSEIRQRKYLDTVQPLIPDNMSRCLDDEYDLLNVCRRSRSGLTVMIIASSKAHEMGIFGSLSLIKAEYQLIQGVDHVCISTHHIDVTDPIILQTKEMCAFLHTHFELKDKTRIKLDFDLDLSPSSLGGNSMGLAMAILASDRLKYYRKNPAVQTEYFSDVGITGALAEDGAVLPVDDHGLKLKLRAAFFSRLNAVVIPSTQIETATRCLTSLRKKYPLRNFNVIPISHIAHVTHQREVVNIQRRKISSRVSQFVKDYANSVTYGIMGFIVLCAALFYFLIVKNPVPDHITIETGDIMIRNKFGFNLWQVNSYTKPNLTETEKKSEINIRTTIIDLNGDGKDEVIIGYGFNSVPEKQGLLICYDAHGNEEWVYGIGEKSRFGDNHYTENFAVSHLMVTDLNFDNQYEIIVTGFNNFFPYHLAVIDNKGSLISDYWHSGYLLDFRIVDLLPENNTKELLITGMNNEYKSGILMLLDPFRIMGTSPQQGFYYKKYPNDPGNEIYYVRFPTTDFQDKLHTDLAVIIGNSEKTIEVRIYTTNNLINEDNDDVNSVFYAFNDDFKVTFTELADGYYRNYKKMYPDRPPLPYNDIETTNYFRSVDYWDGDKWVKEPVMNRRYLESLKKEN